MPQKIMKTLAGAITGIPALFTQVPGDIKQLLGAFLVLLVIDSITGIWVAGRRKKLASHTFSQKLGAKLLQYLILIGIGGALGAAFATWKGVSLALYCLMGVEVFSNIENLAVLEKEGGAPVGKFKPFLQWISQYLEATNRADGSAKSTPPAGDKEDTTL
jgi:phage-related holin